MIFRKFNIKNDCNKFLLTEMQLEAGFANKIFNIIINIAISLQSGKCLLSKPKLIFKVQNIDYLSEYYAVYGNINDYALQEILDRKLKSKNIKRYSRDTLCSCDLFKTQAPYIIYSDAGISSCSSENFKKTFSKISDEETHNDIIDNDFVLRIQYNIFNKYFSMTHKATQMLNEYLASQPKSFNGIHIRTYGCFKDFNEKTSYRVFNISIINSYFADLINNSTVSTYYIASDSIKMKKYIEKLGKSNGVSVIYSKHKVKHSRSNKMSLDKSTFFELELMSISKELLLTNLSTFSMLIFFKNKNCFKNNRCIFMDFIDNKEYKDYDIYVKRLYI